MRHLPDSAINCACCEPWVIAERQRIQEAHKLRVSLLEALGLRVVQLLTFEEIRRIGAWDRMLRRAA